MSSTFFLCIFNCIRKFLSFFIFIFYFLVCLLCPNSYVFLQMTSILLQLQSYFLDIQQLTLPPGLLKGLGGEQFLRLPSCLLRKPSAFTFLSWLTLVAQLLLWGAIPPLSPRSPSTANMLLILFPLISLFLRYLQRSLLYSLSRSLGCALTNWVEHCTIPWKKAEFDSMCKHIQIPFS